MSEATSYKIIVGVHRETPVPKQIRAWGWSHRLAFVLDSHRPGCEEMALDARLLLSLLEAFEDSVLADKREIRIFSPYLRRYVSLVNVADLSEFYRTVGEDDWDLPEEITWWRRGALIAQAFPEHWNAVGGPPLYHDSFTLSIYSREDLSSVFKIRLRDGEGIPGNLNGVLVAQRAGV